MKAMYRRPRVNVKFEPRSSFTFTRDHPHIVSTLFTYARKNHATVEINLQVPLLRPRCYPKEIS